MKAALVQQASGRYAAILSAMIPWHLKYCQHHNIIYLPTFGNIVESRHPNWSRFPLLIETLRAGFADIVVWLDSDCVIADPHTSLLDAADEFMLLGAVAHPDPWGDMGFHYNMGAMYLRNTPRAIKFLEAVHKSGKIEGEQWENQGTILRIAETMKFPICRIRNRWNSTPAYNDCPSPVVRSFHGGDNLRIKTAEQMQSELEAIAGVNLRTAYT